MPEGTVTHTGFIVAAERSHMGYRLDHWVAYEGRPERVTTRYGQLSYTELADLLLVLSDNYRPGMVVGRGWSQPVLPID